MCGLAQGRETESYLFVDDKVVGQVPSHNSTLRVLTLHGELRRKVSMDLTVEQDPADTSVPSTSYYSP